ncbi:hypothetical protein GTP46_24470 [Duganella sp. FT135W]|uniref:Uncharacterized protein n=1 Tax=Duganella flavida TaxID=2692175 RepID=A0A6L8KGE0_9BURK|nr:hypothetical protein [Duganella flavida]MYM25787.1 hypothetical protein [Duganella flavida]
MKTIISSAGTFGPFFVVDVLSDRLRADGVDFQFSVIGDYRMQQGAPELLLPPAVPESVPMLNARTQLYKSGLLDQWEALLADMPGDDGALARIKWASALTVRRDDTLVVAGLVMLGLTPEQGDKLFIDAASLIL